MGTRRNDDFSLAGMLLLIVDGIICFGVWKFSQVFGLDFNTALQQIIYLIVFVLILVGAIYLTTQVDSRFASFKVLYPLAIYGFYSSLAPAINYWAKNDHSLGFSGDGMYWWFSWYVRLILFVCAIVVSWLNVKDY